MTGRERVMEAEAPDAPQRLGPQQALERRPASAAASDWPDGWRCQRTFASQVIQAARAPPRKRSLTRLVARTGRGNGTLSVGGEARGAGPALGSRSPQRIGCWDCASYAMGFTDRARMFETMQWTLDCKPRAASAARGLVLLSLTTDHTGAGSDATFDRSPTATRRHCLRRDLFPLGFQHGSAECPAGLSAGLRAAVNARPNVCGVRHLPVRAQHERRVCPNLAMALSAAYRRARRRNGR